MAHAEIVANGVLFGCKNTCSFTKPRYVSNVNKNHQQATLVEKQDQ